MTTARAKATGSTTTRCGSVLLIVLVVVAMITLASYTFAKLMFNEHRAARVYGRGVQAVALADSGVAYLQQFLAEDATMIEQLGGHYDNPDRFRAVLVVDDAQAYERGRFTIVAPAIDGGIPAGVRSGLEDESAKLNLNTLLAINRAKRGAGRTALMALPGMTEEIAAAILDWLDTNERPREFGAEAEYYSMLDPAYGPANGPLQTIEELLLVRGVTPGLLFGVDVNRNGIVDAGESGATSIDGVDNSDGAMTFGWSAYLTSHSLETNVGPDGSEKINLNASKMEPLFDRLTAALDEQQATFIVAYRQFGPTEGRQQGQTVSTVQLDLEKSPKKKLDSVLDLIGARVVVAKEGSPPVMLQSPYSSEPAEIAQYLSELLDIVTIDSSEATAGRININQASRVVLMAIPDMTEDVAEDIINLRDLEVSSTRPEQRHPTWILTEGIVELDTMKALMPFMTSGGSAYRAQIVGYFEQGGPAARIEVILDASKVPARLVSWRDITRLGRGYSFDTLGVQATE